MKKFICVLLCVLMSLATLTMVACDNQGNSSDDTTAGDTTAAPETTDAPEQEAALKFGMGVFTNVSSATDATEDKEGQGKVAITVAAITVDANGKVVACQLDTADITVKYTVDGKAVANDGFKTKYEMGADYNMVAYGGAVKEWFEQADAFETVVAGKTLDEIKALVAEGNKGTDAVVNAGCTIMINEFVSAIEKAFANLADSAATASTTLKLGINTDQSTKDASEDVDGQNQVETTVVAAAVDAQGKVVVAASDCVQVKFTFNATGASTYDLTKAAQSKREQGANYGMVAYGGAAKEWFEQADAFNALCVGKTAAQISALCASDNYGTDEVKTAGCTILVSGLTKAAAKLG
ncbi:MAG: hypothetical protein IIX86_06250 [Clostridia bacterium]|nr:hypothetical protein [Clostridia bacterium]